LIDLLKSFSHIFDSSFMLFDNKLFKVFKLEVKFRLKGNQSIIYSLSFRCNKISCILNLSMNILKSSFKLLSSLFSSSFHFFKILFHLDHLIAKMAKLLIIRGQSLEHLASEGTCIAKIIVRQAHFD